MSKTKLKAKMEAILLWLVEEIKWFSITFLSILAVDGFAQLLAIYNGNLEQDIWLALGSAVLKSAVKAIMQMIFPKLFPAVKPKTI